MAQRSYRPGVKMPRTAASAAAVETTMRGGMGGGRKGNEEIGAKEITIVQENQGRFMLRPVS
jgi:hypothetical protein